MKQVVVDVRGAAYHDRDAPICGSSVPAMKQEVFPYVGFRLASDGGFEGYRGRGFNNGVDIPPATRNLPKEIDHTLLGFRLVVDWRDK